jgi:hypothetical protein
VDAASPVPASPDGLVEVDIAVFLKRTVKLLIQFIDEMSKVRNRLSVPEQRVGTAESTAPKTRRCSRRRNCWRARSMITSARRRLQSLSSTKR